MALSEAEQELLAKLEASLSAEDPKLAHKLAHAPARRIHPKQATLGVVAFLIGIVMLVIGISTIVWVSIGGFVVMLAGAIVFLKAWQTPPGGAPAAAKAAAPSSGPDFMSRLEQRWQDRLRPPQ
jgi:uncharacterized membrane protein